MTYRVNNVDCLAHHEVSAICRAADAAGLDTPNLGALYLGEPVDNAALGGELVAVRDSGSADATTTAAIQTAIDALEGRLDPTIDT